MELATALMKKTATLMKVADKDDGMGDIVTNLVEAVNARCDAFCMRDTDRLNKKQAEKLLSKLGDLNAKGTFHVRVRASCVCVCARACVCVCVRARLCVCVCAE